MLVGHPIKLNDKRMKHLFNSILVAVVLALVGCQAQDAPRETMTNGVELTIPGNAKSWQKTTQVACLCMP